MEQMVDGGLVKQLGVSNFSLKQVEDLLQHARIKPVANQIELHPFLAQRKLVGVCARKVRAPTPCCPRALPTVTGLHCMLWVAPFAWAECTRCSAGQKQDKAL